MFSLSNKWKQLGLLLALLILSLGVVSCGADTEDDTNNADTPVTDTEEMPADDVLPTEIPNEPTIMPMVEDEMDEAMEATDMPEPTATAEMMATEETSVPMDEAEETTMESIDVATFTRASDVIGMELVNNADEDIAEIQEILFDETGQMQYIILDVEEMNEEYPFYAVAWDNFAVSLSDEQTNPGMLFYEDDIVNLEEALGFDDAMLGSDDLFYQTAEDAMVDTQMLDGLYRLSAFAGIDLFDYDLINTTRDDDLGEIEDLLVDLNNRMVQYAVADVGGALGIAETAVAIPWERVSFNADEDYFAINASEEDLTNAPAIDMSEFADWEIDADWQEDIEAYWNDLTTG